MTRNSAREIAVHIIFALGFDNRSAQEVLEAELNNEKQEKYIRTLVQGVFAHGPELDDCISRYSVGWAFARIPRMAAAIMRTAMYEVLYMPDVPNAAAINAAVEMAKKYEPVEMVSFVNGILGTFVRTEVEDSPPKPEKDTVQLEEETD